MRLTAAGHRQAFDRCVRVVPPTLTSTAASRRRGAARSASALTAILASSVLSLVACGTQEQPEVVCAEAAEHAAELQRSALFADPVLASNADVRTKVLEQHGRMTRNAVLERCKTSESYAHCVRDAEDRDALSECR